MISDIECFEIRALFDLCSLYSAYPQDLIKHERPDWINDEIGLEITKAILEEWYQISNVDMHKITLEEIVKMSFDYEGCIMFKCEGGKYDGKLFYYYLHSRIITLPNKTPVLYDNLPDEEKDAINNSIYILSGGGHESNNPLSPFFCARIHFAQKIKKLNDTNYDTRPKNHLLIYSGFFADLRGKYVYKLMHKFIEEQDGYERKFNIVFLRLSEYLLKYDLDNCCVSYFEISHGFDWFAFQEKNCNRQIDGKRLIEIVKTIPNRCFKEGKINENDESSPDLESLLP